ncbi:MAG: T9SS type A sorting domain-containing protein, partial [Saprospiraceae bacterium]
SSDLALFANVDATDYNIYVNVTFHLVLVNNGPDDAGGITVSAGLPQNFVYAGSLATQGQYNLYFQRWDVGYLAAGDTARLDLTLFPLSDSLTVSNFFQVLTSNQDDPDSTPGNDTDQTPNEDDEALATLFGQEQPPFGGVTADLALFATTDTNHFNIYENVTYHLVLVNNGPDAAGGVTVHAGVPQGFVYAGDTTATGQYDLFNQRWNIGLLQSGDTARLDLSLFALVNNANVDNFFEVLTSNQNDPDSTPGNGPNAEDDQVTVTIIPNFNGNEPSENRFGQPQEVAVGTLYPVPAETFINLRIDRAQARESAVIYFYNQQGRLVRTEKTPVLAGSNEWRFEISELAAGVYFVGLPGQIAPIKFIKL